MEHLTLPRLTITSIFIWGSWIVPQGWHASRVHFTKYTLNRYTLERAFKKKNPHFWAFKPSYTFSSILESIHIFEHLSLHTHFWEAFRPAYTPRSIYVFVHPLISVRIPLNICFWRALLPSYIFEHCCLHTTQPKKHSGRQTPLAHFLLITLTKCLKATDGCSTVVL